MSYYPRELVDELMNSIPLEDVARHYGDNPKGRGKNIGIHCPCCDRDQSHCHTNNASYGKAFLFQCKSPQCEAKGSTIDYIRYKEGNGVKEAIRFQDAVKKLAEIAHFPLEQKLEAYRPNAEKQAAYTKQQKALQVAAKFYSEHSHPYLNSRGISSETQKNNKIGFAPGNCLKAYMNKLDFDDSILEEVGLIHRVGNNLVDRFQNRVIFPVFDTQGKVIDLYGRSINPNDRLPHLYLRGQNIAYGFEKLDPKKPVLWVESLVNKLSLEEMGYSNVVAVGGATKFSNYHVNLTRDSGSKEHLFLYDGDSGGRKGALEAGEQLVPIGCAVKIGRVPDELDVNDLLCQGDIGTKQITSILAQAQPFNEAKAFALLEEIDPNIIYKFLAQKKTLERKQQLAQTR
ncbi:toprim domain-containing protein [Brevibacillus centrosporus]|uniref:toprim domain-containing protein n=1 Tax=Brevibacillus centrosporus TaxID=54910 RepID=UPI003D2610BD